MVAGLDGDARAGRVERRDEAAVDVDLGVADVAAQLHDRVVGLDAAGVPRGPAAGGEQRGREGDPGSARQGAPESATSMISPTTFTFADVPLAGGLRTICAIRST